MPPPTKPISREELTAKVREFPVIYGASIVGITSVETLVGGPPTTDLSYVLEGARSAVTFAVPTDADKTRDYLGKVDRAGHQQDYTKTSIIADGIAAQLASFIRQFGHLHLNAGDPFFIYNYRWKVRLWEVAVIIGHFLTSHNESSSGHSIEASRVHTYGIAFFQLRDLSLNFMINGSCHVSHGVHILYLNTIPKFFLAHRPNGNISIAS